MVGYFVDMRWNILGLSCCTKNYEIKTPYPFGSFGFAFRSCVYACDKYNFYFYKRKHTYKSALAWNFIYSWYSWGYSYAVASTDMLKESLFCYQLIKRIFYHFTIFCESGKQNSINILWVIIE